MYERDLLVNIKGVNQASARQTHSFIRAKVDRIDSFKAFAGYSFDRSMWKYTLNHFDLIRCSDFGDYDHELTASREPVAGFFCDVQWEEGLRGYHRDI